VPTCRTPPSRGVQGGEVYARQDLISEQARAFARANRDRPFFRHVPTTVPHLALPVPEDSLAEYRGKFPEEPYDGSRGIVQPHPRSGGCPMRRMRSRGMGS
jgi:arylsulfatase